MSANDVATPMWRRRDGCRATMRGISPWACELIDAAKAANPELSESQLHEAFRNGSLKVLEGLHPPCIECGFGKPAE